MYQCCKCENFVVKTYTNREGQHYCLWCVGLAEAETVVNSESAMNPLNLTEFDEYHKQLAVIRGSSNIVPKN